MSSDPALLTFRNLFVPNIQAAPYHAKWVSANKVDAAKWTQFRDALLAWEKSPPVPTMATKYGKALVAAGEAHMAISRVMGFPVPPFPPTPIAVPLVSIPTGLVATPGDGQVTLTWNPNPAGEQVDFYQVYEADQFQQSWLSIPTTSFVVTQDHLGNPLANGTQYSFRVSAHNVNGYGNWSNAVTATPQGSLPPPANRYTDMDFSSGLMVPEFPSGSSVFLCSTSDPRLASWGGLEPVDYDARGCTQDSTMRVHLFHPTSRGLPANPNGASTWASWQELRTTDGPWSTDTPDLAVLAKASLSGTQGMTWGSQGYSLGATRWWAWDYLLPLNINFNGNVSFEFAQRFHTLMDMHASSGVDGDPCITVVSPFSGHPRFLSWWNSPVTKGPSAVPYIEVDFLQLTNANGTRITSVFNVWHELVVGFKAGTTTGTGWFEIWHDGVQIAPQTARATVNPSEAGPYLQMQNYTQYSDQVGGPVIPFVGGATRSAIVYGGFRAGLARNDVQTR